MPHRFDRYGRSFHLRIESARELEYAKTLDPALWIATSMPTSGISADQEFLRYLDVAGNRRIIHREIADAIEWVLSRLSDHAVVEDASDRLDVASLNTQHSDSQSIARTAERIRVEAGLSPDEPITLSLVQRVKAELLKKPVSDAGVVLPAASEDVRIAEAIRKAIRITGGVEHPNGERGINAPTLEAFLASARAYLDIARQKDAISIDESKESHAIYARYRDVIEKIDEYFSLCASVAIGNASVASASGTPVEDLPLALPGQEASLNFDEFVNPAYVEKLEDFREDVLNPLTNESAVLTPREWTRVKQRFEPAQRIESARQGLGSGVADHLDEIEDLGDLINDTVVEQIRNLIGESNSVALTVDEVRMVEKLLLFQKHIMCLVNNSVSFPDLYDRSARAWFEMGSLVLDNRTFRLAVLVENRQRHVAMSRNSSMYVLYAQVRKSRDVVAYEVACPVTSGGKGNLAVGKKGIFIDRAGNELDAEVVEIIENPISVREAIASPFRRLGKTITGKFDVMTTQADQQLQQLAGSTVESIGTAVPNPSQPSQPSQPAAQGIAAGGLQSGGRGAMWSLLLGGSLAIAAVGSALAYVTNTLSSLKWWQVVGGFAAAIVAVAMPAVIVATLKLRRRDMGAVIEASGWAVNVPLRLTRRLQRAFTARPKYPPGSRGIPFWSRRWVRVALYTLAGTIITVGVLLIIR